MSTSSEMASPAECACRIGGEVLHGDKMGRVLGFPTPNMTFSGREKPTYKIHAARKFLPDGHVFDAAANFGFRPSFTPTKEPLEAHILDFSEDLCDQHIEFELVHFLLPEKKSKDMASLSDQHRQDCILAREAVAERSADYRSAIS